MGNGFFGILSNDFFNIVLNLRVELIFFFSTSVNECVQNSVSC